MNPETIIKRNDIDGQEIAKRLEGCLGYISSRAASNLNNPDERVKLEAMYKAVDTCLKHVRHIAPTRFDRTEYARVGA